MNPVTQKYAKILLSGKATIQTEHGRKNANGLGEILDSFFADRLIQENEDRMQKILDQNKSVKADQVLEKINNAIKGTDLHKTKTFRDWAADHVTILIKG